MKRFLAIFLLISSAAAQYVFAPWTQNNAIPAAGTDTTVRSVATNSAATGTAVSVSQPTGTATGDLMIVVIHANNATTIVDNNGGTAFTEDLNDYQETTGGETVSVFSRRIVGGDPATYAFTIGTSGRWSIAAICFANPHASVIYDVSPTTSTFDKVASGATTWDAPSITTANNKSIHVCLGAPDGSNNVVTSQPSGYTSLCNSGDEFVSLCYKVITPAGAITAKTFIWTSSDAAITGSFAIRNAQ